MSFMTSNTINDAVTMAGGERSILANRYRIVKQLGQGGMGSVWLAEDTQLDGRLFAIKMLPSILVSNKRAYRQLKDEALVAMKLTHPNIVTLRAFEENNGNPFLVMDYIDGQSLDDYLAEKGKLSEDETIKLLRPIAAALDYAHTKGVVHRDVKPGNIMIAKDGTPYILDFGIAREIQETMTRVTGKLSSGTLLYMSPEQLNGEPPTSSQDIYSFAAMSYECLKGEPPFSRGQIEHQILSNPPPPLTEGACAAPIMSGLAKKPEDRPATCAGVLSGVDSSRVEHVERVEKDKSGERSNIDFGRAVGVLAFLVALMVGGYYVWAKYDKDARECDAESLFPNEGHIEKLTAEDKELVAESETHDKGKAVAVNAKVSAEYEKRKMLLEASVRLCAINVSPEGCMSVGFSDNSCKPPVAYYMAVGETRDGWLVKSADIYTKTAVIEKDGVEVEIGLSKSATRTATPDEKGNSDSTVASEEIEQQKAMKLELLRLRNNLGHE